MTLDNVWVGLLLVGVGGMSLGVGLVVGAFVARTLRRYMKDENLNGKS